MMSMVKILVVDDEPDTVDLIDTMLKMEGYETVKAYSGKECLSIVDKESPDLIMLDLMMPDMSGFDVCEEIMKMKKANLKIIIVSVIEASVERKGKMKDMGISDYITKPFTKNELMGKVKSVLENR
jgi:DNA-binding response OmpR family regulator